MARTTLPPAGAPKAELSVRVDDLLELRHQAHSLGLAAQHLVNSQFAGLYASVFRGVGLNFEEVREYREGDDIRNMDWKVTARTDKPHLKIFREERERSVVLCVDRGPHMNFGTRGTFKAIQAARAAALIGWAASGQHDRVGGLVFGNPRLGMAHFRPAKGRHGLWRLLNAPVQPPGDEDQTPNIDCLQEALRRAERGAGTGSLIFVIGDFNRSFPGLEQRLVGLRQRHDLALIPIDDPADYDLPDLGVASFITPDGEILEVDTSDLEGCRRYREQWQERRNQLKALCNRLGVLLLPLRTDEDVHLALLLNLRQYSRR